MWSVLFVFLSYLDRVPVPVQGDLLDAEKESQELMSALNGSLCARTSGENVVYRLTDGLEAVRAVFSPAGKMLDCSLLVEEAPVRAFAQECGGPGGVREGLGGRFARMDEAKLMCREFQEKQEEEEEEEEKKAAKRSKRGFTYPGTLWCGAGNMADDDSQLGEFAETDSCCRTHDHCPHVIHAFSSKYGYTNFKWHSICHCDCDEALKACLRRVNDTSSRVVGQAFFNVMGVPCFHFAYEEQCVERHWYGVCKRSERLPVAVLKEAVPYDYGGIDVIDVLTLAPPKVKGAGRGSGEAEPESPTQSAVPGPEEPSLGNVVTAAEDFIKVLATVSTSHSSAGDSHKGQSQSSGPKKRRKNLDKKKKDANRKPKGGRGRKRKQKAAAAAAAAKVEDGAAPAAGGRAEEVAALSNFIGQESRRAGGGGRHQLTLHQEPSNEVMRDQPVPQAQKEESAAAAAAAARQEKNPRLKKGRRKRKKTPPPPPPQVPKTTEEEEDREGVSVPAATAAAATATITTTTTATTITTTTTTFTTNTTTTFTTTTTTGGAGATRRSQQRGSSGRIGVLERRRWRERGDGGGGKKRRRGGCATETPNNSSTPPPDPQPRLPHGPDAVGGRTDGGPRPSFSLLKGQRSKERAPRAKKRKTSPSCPAEDAEMTETFQEASHGGGPAPEARAAVGPPPDPRCECWRFVTDLKRLRPRKPRRKAPRRAHLTATGTAALATTTQTPPPPRTWAARPSTISPPTFSPPTFSPLQLSLQRAQEQFSRKKRRKAAMGEGRRGHEGRGM